MIKRGCCFIDVNFLNRSRYIFCKQKTLELTTKQKPRKQTYLIYKEKHVTSSVFEKKGTEKHVTSSDWR